MANPLVYGGSQPNKATAPAAAVNSLAPAVARQKNTFYMPQQVLQTERFADIMPFFVMDCVPNDDVSFKSNVDQRPQSTFASPLMSQFRKHRGYIAVPKSVIFPRLWSKIFVNPKKGDDVDFDNVQAAFNPRTLLQAFQNFWQNSFLKTTPDDEGDSSYFLQSLYVASQIFSPYSVLSYLELGCYPVAMSVSGYSSPVNFDFLLLQALKALCSGTGEDNGVNITLSFTNGVIRRFFCRSDIDFRAVFDLMKSPNISWPGCSITDSGLNPISMYPAVQQLKSFTSGNVVNRLINIQRVIAYQMSIAQFFTSDDVDDIFTSELWYQNMNGLIDRLFSTSGFPSFSYNGISILYEPYSAYVINQLVFKLNTTTSASLSNDTSLVLSYFGNLFESARSLRYGDMFNASRMQPLAVGDVNAPVSGNNVSAVDMTRATLMQRFLNAVNSVRNTIRGYAAMLYGVQPDDVPIEPKFVAHSVVDLAGNLVANTADNQGNLETNLVLHDGRNEFDIHLNQDTILLGLSWYDCLATYPSPLSPFGLHIDRFDDFNPMLQNIGDVPVPSVIFSSAYGVSTSGGENTFGYLQNDYEYKQSIGRALGGYVTGALGSAAISDSNFLFPTESSWGFIRNFLAVEGYQPESLTVNSDFIRQHNIEFDSIL